MNPRALRVLYEALSRIGLNPSLEAADIPDTWIVRFVEGPRRLEPGRALDLGCGAGRNTRYLAQHGWEVIGIDMLGRAIDKPVPKPSTAQRNHVSCKATSPDSPTLTSATASP